MATAATSQPIRGKHRDRGDRGQRAEQRLAEPTAARRPTSPPASSGADGAVDAARERPNGSVRSSGCGATVPPSSETSGQRLRELGGELVERPALVGPRAQRGVDRRAQLLRQVLARAPQRRQHGADAARGRGGRAGADRVDARQRLVEHEREAVEVAALVDALAGGLLGRHVGEGADDVAGPRERLVAGQVGDAEVGQLGHAGRRARRVGDDHVLRLDVAVHDAAAVRVLERAAQREADPQHVAVASARPRR